MMVRGTSHAVLAGLIATFASVTIACSSSNATNSSATPSPAAASPARVADSAAPALAAATAATSAVKIRIVTSDGTILAVLDPAHAPLTVANFLHYVDSKFFNGGTFFRAIPNFVIQGGNKAEEAPSDPTVNLEDPQKTGLLNLDGSLAMARTSDPNSATSEFFIDDGKQTSLDGTPDSPGYAVFGHVLSGMDIVRKIARLPANSEYLVTPVKILKIERVH